MNWWAYFYYLAGTAGFGVWFASKRTIKRLRQQIADAEPHHRDLHAAVLGGVDIHRWHRSHGNSIRCEECYEELDRIGHEKGFILTHDGKRIAAWCQSHAPIPEGQPPAFDIDY